MGETVRFSELMKEPGKPEIYLPLSDPKLDRNFMRAVRDNRVMSLKQEPTGTKKDFGIVGFVAEKYMSYLIFPKPLTPFKGKRVVGIKYDRLSEAPFSTPRAPVSVPSRSVKPAKPKTKPRPRPKRFTATVRLTSTNEVKVTVEAFDEREARTKAEQAARRHRDSRKAVIATGIIRPQRRWP